MFLLMAWVLRWYNKEKIMFERILIKSGSNNTERFLSIADLVDMMFYYGEVHVVASQFELKQLFTIFGEDVLYELITTGRLIVHPCDQHIGASRYGEYDSVGLFGRNFQSIDELLSNFHKETNSNPIENKRFAKKFSTVLTEYRYPQNIHDSLYIRILRMRICYQELLKCLFVNITRATRTSREFILKPFLLRLLLCLSIR